MKIDKIILTLSNYRSFKDDERLEVEMWRGNKFRRYKPTPFAISKLMSATRMELASWSGGTRHLRFAMFPKKEEQYDPPF